MTLSGHTRGRHRRICLRITPSYEAHAMKKESNPPPPHGLKRPTPPPAPPSKRRGEPEGWRLVPVEPTGEMILELMVCGLRHAEYKKGCSPTVNDMAQGYKAMLAAAPEPPSPPPCVTEASLRMGAWLSAALEDENACDELKEDIRAWFDAAMPVQQACPDVSALVEALEGMIIGACAVAVPHNGERAVLQDAVRTARAALAAYRKQWGEK